MNAGKTRARVAITAFSVVTSVLLVAGFLVVCEVPAEDWLLYMLPAVVVPLVVAPMASYLVLELTFELEAAHALASQQEAQLRALFEHAPIGIARLDHRGQVRTANARLRAILGIGEPGAIPDWSALFVDPLARETFLCALATARPLEAARWQWADGAGAERTVRTALVPMPASRETANLDRPDSVLLAEDITEREAVAAQLLRAQKLDLVGRLAGGLAHDFNNLLTVVRANVATLGGTAVAPELAAIDDAAVRGARLTRRLLSISRHDLLTVSPHALAPLLQDSVELMRRVLPARIRVVAPVMVPEVTLELDPDAVQQALLNLAVNARDAIAAEGVIQVEVRVAAAEAPSMLVLAVVDDGIGMSAAVLARAAEPFFTTKSADTGSGLGLAMVHATMRRHGGRLVLHSTEGAGTRAELWFPIASSGATALPPDAPPATAVDAPRDATEPRAHLLLVEDEHSVRIATERALRRLAYAVTGAPDMSCALRHLRSGATVDLVVTDVMMPGGTGLELLQIMRAEGRSTPVLLVSGYAVDNLATVLAQDPRTALLTKPWTLDRLAGQVHAMLASAAEPNA
ncbi:MAG: response regulator [Planctomycetes bacterium]|nr:response regulator [Planctomycetota bacterium]